MVQLSLLKAIKTCPSLALGFLEILAILLPQFPIARKAGMHPHTQLALKVSESQIALSS